MAVLKIENFGGELPSVSPRALPADAAQTNRNLFLAPREFRPLATDLTVAACEDGTKTLHRFARGASGEFNTNPATGWISSTQERSYVKGQVNDERTERTYFTFDDGSARPRAIDATGADRLLGVPRPASLTATVNVVDEFTPDEADNFLYGEAAEAIKAAISSSIPAVSGPGSRYGTDGATLAGPYGSFPDGRLYPNSMAGFPSRWQFDWWLMVARPDLTRFNSLGVSASEVGAVTELGFAYVPIVAVPYARIPDRAALASKLLAIEFPATAGDKAGQAVFTTDQANALADKVIAALSPNTYAKSLRDQLDSTVKEFAKILYDDAAPANVTPPVEPTKPTVPELVLVSSGEVDHYARAPEWVAYDNAMREYREDLAAYEEARARGGLTSTTIAGRLSELRAKAESLTKQIEALCDKAVELVKSGNFATQLIDGEGGVEGLVGETVTRIIETRFYIATFVTDWGEESAPCKPSALIEIDQNDSVTITRPVTASGESFASRNITKWRLYRSNTGSETSAFQFVDEMDIGTGSYTDSKKAEELGEVCPTLTWDEPPYRADQQFDGFPKPVVGTNPYLRGLVGMPNGIMAGFFDNTVAFCEPYVPYAWPVEYQITTEFPIVGLGVFGQTLFVGTTGNPYFISGADSASMSALKLDARQACVSRRSIASVQGGVLYASPDGLCAADPSGVKVVSAPHFTREDWQKLNPSTMIAASHENLYYLFYTGQGGGCLVFDLAAGKLGRVDLTATAAFTDTLTDTLYVANGANIQAVHGGANRRTATWKSARLVMQRQAPMAWLKVYGDQTPSAPVTIRWFGDGQLRHTATITSTAPVRLPPGRWLEHEVEVESTSRVTRVVMAGDTTELQSV